LEKHAVAFAVLVHRKNIGGDLPCALLKSDGSPGKHFWELGTVQEDTAVFFARSNLQYKAPMLKLNNALRVRTSVMKSSLALRSNETKISMIIVKTTKDKILPALMNDYV